MLLNPPLPGLLDVKPEDNQNLALNRVGSEHESCMQTYSLVSVPENALGIPKTSTPVRNVAVVVNSAE